MLGSGDPAKHAADGPAGEGEERRFRPARCT